MTSTNSEKTGRKIWKYEMCDLCFVKNTTGWKQANNMKQNQAKFPTPTPVECDFQLS